MQIVINIDDNLYTRLFDNGDEYVAGMRRACVAIRKGTPLVNLPIDEVTSLFKDVHELPPVNPQPKWDKLYSWLNDMWLGIAPDETVHDDDERRERQAQVDVIDDIMEWMVEPHERRKE